MELMDTNLERAIEDNTLSVADKLQIALDVAAGLQFLHRCDPDQILIAHRNLKTSNILLRRTSSGTLEVKIGDFGCSRIQGEYESAHSLVGALYSKAPEVLAASQTEEEEASGYDPRAADVFSYAMVIYELFSGLKPFSRAGRRYPNSEIVVNKILRGQRPRIDLLQTPDNAFLQKVYLIMILCWDQLPNNRPSMEQVVHYLENGTIEELQALQAEQEVYRQQVQAEIPH